MSSAAYMATFITIGVVFILVSIFFFYRYKDTKQSEWERNQRSKDEVVGGWKHFWLANRSKTFWFIGFVFILVGIGLIVVGITGSLPDSGIGF
jgi:heme/copper-type cytochrome/quinol oxidase subunit 2